jgi:UDP-N-acetylglucosamine transferase subunit ALG13
VIFVVVGNAQVGFKRLIQSVDEIAENGILKGEEIFIQTGNTLKKKKKNCDTKPFLSLGEFLAYMEAADLIICHGGCGTILHAVRLGKVPVVMPRREKYGEIVNDHQLQLVDALAAESRIVPVYEPADLSEAIVKARKKIGEISSYPSGNMVKLVSLAIDEIIS